MEDALYGIVFFLSGHYHILCREGVKYHFHVQSPDLEPAKMYYIPAREFIESHPVCTNLTHEIRIMPYGEIMDIIQGKTLPSEVRSIILGNGEYEEPLH